EKIVSIVPDSEDDLVTLKNTVDGVVLVEVVRLIVASSTAYSLKTCGLFWPSGGSWTFQSDNIVEWFAWLDSLRVPSKNLESLTSTSDIGVMAVFYPKCSFV
ncbi:hypothetical protein Tco_1426899, partial [Tanacetum coccineum]